MACYHPLRAWRSDDGEILFAERGRIHSQITLACGQCIGCRLERSRQWAVRCMHESKTHRYNSFLTLTYNDNNLPPYGTLRYQDYQAFMKRLIKSASRGGENSAIAHTPSAPGHRSYAASRRRKSSNIRFYMCGEYGETYRRPHYHACLFGADFKDKVYLAKSPTGKKLWRSPELERLWPHGFSSIGELTFESAAYVARYVMKKITGQQAKKHYERIDPNTGEIIDIKPEFNQMSRGQGIGKAWLERFETDVYPSGKVIVRGIQTQPPRYYDKQYKKLHPLEWEALEYDRHIKGKEQHQEQQPHRLQAREKVAAAKISMLKRKIG